MNQLSIKNLCKTYANGVVAINNISLEIGNGMFGLLGPNGAGKSSLMKTIVGLQAPDSGEVIFNGTDVLSNPTAIKKHLGFLPQDFGVYPKISAYDLLSHMAILKGVTNAAERKEQILALLHQVNLYPHRKKEVYTFSGGMRQRFGVAQALLGNPQLIIVDEPTAGLDPEERNRFNTLLSGISEEVIIILSTHLVEDVHSLCDNMAIINCGMVLASGKPDDLIRELEGKIWLKEINLHEMDQYKNDLHVISSRWVGGKINIHVLADQHPENFKPIFPSLEDVYFSTLNP